MLSILWKHPNKTHICRALGLLQHIDLFSRMIEFRIITNGGKTTNTYLGRLKQRAITVTHND